MIGDRFRLERSEDGVKRLGYEEPWAKVMIENERVIVVKYPGSSYWIGRGMSRGYAPAHLVVYGKLLDTDRVELLGEEVK
jgi:hypothetical protein